MVALQKTDMLSACVIELLGNADYEARLLSCVEALKNIEVHSRMSILVLTKTTNLATNLRLPAMIKANFKKVFLTKLTS
jgi:hypothetical protein